MPLLRPGQIVVLDNLSVQQQADARTAIEAIDGVLAFLPVYSPDLNPIELVFAGLKAWLRGVKARTPGAVMQAFGTGLDRVTPALLTACHRHCGYQAAS